MDITRDFLYKLNLLYNLSESAEYEFAMREAILIETGNYNMAKVMILQEGFADTIKEFFNRVPEIVNELITKFENLFNQKYTNDKNYIDSHMDAFNKDPEAKDIQVFNYDIDKIKQSHDLHLNYETIKDDLEDLGNTQKKLFPDFATDDPNDFAEHVKNILRGNPESDRPTVKLDKNLLEKCKDYVINYTNIRKELQKDKKDILSTVNSFKTIVNSKQKETPDNNGSTNESYYSYLFGKNILLEEENNSSSDNKSSENKSTESNNSNNQNTEKDKAANNILKSAVKSAGKVANDFSAAFKRAKNGITVILKFFSAKMAIANECYNEYIKIIRNHIDGSSGESGGASDLSEEETKKAQEIIKNDVLDSNNEVKQLDDAGKANLFSKLKGVIKNEKSATKVFNNIISKMKKNNGGDKS